MDLLGFFLTWNTYGTWLPGDARGWVEFKHGWHLPDPIRELEASARMSEAACRLTVEQRATVEQQIGETCKHRNWHLHAVNCRSNHVHVLVTALNTPPRKVRTDLKAWTTRRLKAEFDPARDNWWVERGSIRHLYGKSALDASVVYVVDAQDRMSEGARVIT